jgi:CubicO group peptidase (beta-lactamase class C family)
MNGFLLPSIGLATARGFDARVLRAFDQRIEDDVAREAIAGATTVVVRDGTTAFEWAHGWQDPTARVPMALNSMFWIASMTKPVVCAAALTLVDDDVLQLDDPVVRFVPSFAKLGTVDRPDVPVGHRMTVRDLMRHTSGLTYGSFGDSDVQRLYQARGAYRFDQSNAQMLHVLSELPLQYEPGTTFEYGMSTDVLGGVLEAATGQPLDAVVAERITGPLGMADTRFRLTPEQLARVARPLPKEDFSMAPPAAADVAWLSGGGGLWSTARDYARFATMLLQRGHYAGRRILSEQRVADMLGRQLPQSVRFGAYVHTLASVAPTPAMGQTFGLGVSVRLGANRNPLPGSPGDFTWPGLSGCNFWCDPVHGLVVVQMLQAPGQRHTYRGALRTAIYEALGR